MQVIFLILLFAVTSCNTETQELEETVLEMNYDELIKGFTELSPLLPDVIEVIQSIKAGNWTEVVVKFIELVSKGYPIVKECISVFTYTEQINLTHTITRCCGYSMVNFKIKCVKRCPITSPKI